MNSRTFLKWVSAWAAIVLAQGALLSANAATVVYQDSNEYDKSSTFPLIDIGASDEDRLLKLEFYGKVDGFSYNAYLYVRGYDGSGANKVRPYVADGLDLSSSDYQRYCRIYRIPSGLSKIKVEPQNYCWVKDITVSIVSVEEAMDVYDSIWADVNQQQGSTGGDLLQKTLEEYPISAQSIPSDPFAKLPKFKDALLNGTPCHIHLLGGSAETWCSSFQTLIQDAYPNSKLKFTTVNEGDKGCWSFVNEDLKDWVLYKNGETYEVPNVLVIGGINNIRPGGVRGTLDEQKGALCDVIAYVKEHYPAMDVLYLSTQRGCDSRGNIENLWEPEAGWLYSECPPMSWVSSSDPWAQQVAYNGTEWWADVLKDTGAQCWDVFPQYQEFVYQSGRPCGWFNRDAGGNDARGRELLSRVLFEYVKTGVPVPGGDSNEDAAASTNFVGVARVKVPAKLNEKVLIAVPWINGVTAGVDNPVSVSNLVKTANLRENDQLWWYDSVNSKYMVWKINAQTNWTEVTTVTKGDEFEEDKFEAATAPDSKLLARGDAVLLWRVNSEDWSKPVYLSGMDTDSPVTFTFGKKAGLSLFAPPSVSNLAGVDFTTATWTGLSDGDAVKFINAKGAMVSFSWKNGKWNGLGSKVIPIGIGAWFSRAQAGTENITVTFPGGTSGK